MILSHQHILKRTTAQLPDMSDSPRAPCGSATIRGKPNTTPSQQLEASEIIHPDLDVLRLETSPTKTTLLLFLPISDSLWPRPSQAMPASQIHKTLEIFKDPEVYIVAMDPAEVEEHWIEIHDSKECTCF